MKTSRELCLSALIRMEKDEAYSNIVLNSLLEKCTLSREEKAFATRIFYGVLEKKLVLDFNISCLIGSYFIIGFLSSGINCTATFGCCISFNFAAVNG